MSNHNQEIAGVAEKIYVELAPTVIAPQGPNAENLAKQSFEAYKERKNGRPIRRLRRISKRRRRGPPRPEYLTGVQYRLNATGFGAGPVDGIFGPKTKRATRKFQSSYGLRVDTIPGPKTQGKLAEVCGY